MRPSMQLGQDGEDLAAAHLTAAGMEVLARNWRCREGELDIVARDGEALVFVEVIFSLAQLTLTDVATRLKKPPPLWAGGLLVVGLGVLYPEVGRMVLATGHATPEEHLLLTREGRSQGLNVLLGKVIREPLRAATCLGLALWMFDRDRKPLIDWLTTKFSKNPVLAEATLERPAPSWTAAG